MHRKQGLRGVTALALTVVLLMRVAIPAGLMPSDDGWFLKVCPDGLPVRVAAIFGDEHAHHHQPDDGISVQCDLSGPALADLALSADTLAEAELRTNRISPVINFIPALPSAWQQRPARAPPASHI